MPKDTNFDFLSNFHFREQRRTYLKVDPVSSCQLNVSLYKKGHLGRQPFYIISDYFFVVSVAGIERPEGAATGADAGLLIWF